MRSVCPNCKVVVGDEEYQVVIEQQIVENLDTGEKTVYPSDEEIQKRIDELKQSHENAEVSTDESTEERSVEVEDPKTKEKKTFTYKVTTRRYTVKLTPFKPVIEKTDNTVVWKCPKCGRVLVIFKKA